ncbi:hypothetical protein GCM10023321_83960 [Pseudonocardia eucalypti]|uniref:Uncharacterized protein n=1 Tax=Pseudonocardia eucalypti TaxID=648755 RepID=A0ABP9RF58_9PSEU
MARRTLIGRDAGRRGRSLNRVRLNRPGDTPQSRDGTAVRAGCIGLGGGPPSNAGKHGAT